MREAQALPCCWRRVSAIAEPHTLFENSLPVKPASPRVGTRFKGPIWQAGWH